uniref:lactate racemase domain-containing protein n=1 Tax=Arachnia propionica TaxID=1750 RepID=UPI003C6FC061
MEAAVVTRPGFVLKVDERTPPLLTLAGGNVSLQRFPTGTGVVYPPQPVPSSDPVALVEGALANPVNSTPLAGLLHPGMKLTVAVGNVDPVQPGMRFDIRRSIVERVLEHAARARVDDVAIVVAGGLGPRWGGQDIVEALGDRVATSFLPEGRIT